MAKAKDKSSGEDTATSAMAATMTAINPVAAKAWQEIMSESTRFLSDRLKQDLETQSAILACKTPAELMEVQSAFFKTAMEQYSAYAFRMQKTLTSATTDAAKSVRASHSRGYDDVPL